MSADPTAETAAEAVRRGAQAVMQKPFDMDAVEPALVNASLVRQQERHGPGGRLRGAGPAEGH
jgi:DNA-binding NtrC family response regulator